MNHFLEGNAPKVPALQEAKIHGAKNIGHVLGTKCCPEMAQTPPCRPNLDLVPPSSCSDRRVHIGHLLAPPWSLVESPVKAAFVFPKFGKHPYHLEYSPNIPQYILFAIL